MKIKHPYLSSFIPAAILVIPAIAFATITVQLDGSGNATTTPGTTLILNGTITNNDSQQPIYLNSTANSIVSTSDPSLQTSALNSMLDQSALQNYLPPMLTAGQVFTGPLIKLDISSTTPPGEYWGAYNIIGGASATSTNVLANQLFYIHLQPSQNAASTTPATVATTTASSIAAPQGLQYSDLTGGNSSSTAGGLQYSDLTGGSGGSNANGLQMQGTQYANGPRLIKLDGGDGTLYWVNANNFKIVVPNNVKVLKSYGITADNATAVSQDELDYYQDTAFIRLNGNARIYKLEGNVKRFIPSSVWNNGEIDAGEIVDVNKTEFNYYKTGKPLSSIDELSAGSSAQ